MERLLFSTNLEVGPDKQARVLFEGPRRKMMELVLRNGFSLAAHKAAEPITIQWLAGSGRLEVGGEFVGLSPGVLVTLEANEVHAVHAQPAVAILLTRFTG